MMRESGKDMCRPDGVLPDPLPVSIRGSLEAVTSLVEQALDVPAARVTLVGPLGFEGAASRACNLSGDMQTDRRRVRAPDLSPDLVVCASLPVATPGGQHLGALCLFDFSPRQFSPRQLQILAGFAEVVGQVIALRLMAEIDFLTQVLNRRGFETAVQHLRARVGFEGVPCVLVMIDIDEFKQVNDSHGHAVGDKVLQVLAASVAGVIRGSDAIARIGGDEFALLLMDTGLHDAREVAARIHTAVAALKVDACPDLVVSVSIGLVEITAQAESAALLDEVDAAVYCAKRRGGRVTGVTIERNSPTAPC